METRTFRIFLKEGEEKGGYLIGKPLVFKQEDLPEQLRTASRVLSFHLEFLELAELAREAEFYYPELAEKARTVLEKAGIFE